MPYIPSELRDLEALDFTGKGEDFVGSKFVTPLLSCLGYETHGDYDVIRPGDNNSRFKIHYPVHSGAKKVKHYNPDYLPTIRRKMFWVIEAKSARVKYPFRKQYIVQGAQYCVHPEIQAKYLLLTNGLHSCVYDVHGSAFLNKDLYQPILEFSTSGLRKSWKAIFELLSIERMRGGIEDSLKTMYDKLCDSSLDKGYPQQLLQKVGADARASSKRIEKHVWGLRKQREEAASAAWWAEIRSLTTDQIYSRMNVPLGIGGRVEGHWFVEQSLIDGHPEADIFQRLTSGYEEHSIFRKLQSYAALCHLHFRAKDPALKAACFEFLKRAAYTDLPLLNQVECTFLRVLSKYLTAKQFPQMRAALETGLKDAPELVRFVHRPTVLGMTDSSILREHEKRFAWFKTRSPEQLQEALELYLGFEAHYDESYQAEYARLPLNERPLIGGFASYGQGGSHYQFRGMFKERGLETADVPA
jgi:hypothetical protein